MTAEVYTGPCAHTGKGDDKVTQQLYGTEFCPKCGASKGIDKVWRVLKEDEDDRR